MDGLLLEMDKNKISSWQISLGLHHSHQEYTLCAEWDPLITKWITELSLTDTRCSQMIAPYPAFKSSRLIGSTAVGILSLVNIRKNTKV